MPELHAGDLELAGDLYPEHIARVELVGALARPADGPPSRRLQMEDAFFAIYHVGCSNLILGWAGRPRASS
jgi:hypothetical protein